MPTLRFSDAFPFLVTGFHRRMIAKPNYLKGDMG